jgi:thiol-disulfide isomerase/thioredoxin
LLPALCLASHASAQEPATPAKAATLAATAKPRPVYESDPKFQSALEDAKQAKHKRMYSFAEDDYKKANKIAGGQCFKCLDSLWELQMGVGNFKDAAATATTMLPLATTPAERSFVEGMQGHALLRQAGDKPKPAQLEAAHAVLQTALTDYPKNNGARWNDACVLARMGKNDEASREFSACAEQAAPTDPMRIRAKHFAENPELSLSKMAPAFEVTALDGTRFNLDSMSGKVVLIDFWATWCGPCNEELPHVQKIAKEFAGQPLVIISVSWDKDEAKWKDFINKHEMTWLQYRDADHALSDRFGVQAIPHYFTIDSDGVLTAEMLGSGSDVEGKLKKLIKRANEARAANPQVAGQIAPTSPSTD